MAKKYWCKNLVVVIRLRRFRCKLCMITALNDEKINKKYSIINNI